MTLQKVYGLGVEQNKTPSSKAFKNATENVCVKFKRFDKRNDLGIIFHYVEETLESYFSSIQTFFWSWFSKQRQSNQFIIK